MVDFFNAAVKIVLDHEGGYVNDPSDHGGETNFGITQRTLTAYLTACPAPLSARVKDLTREQATEIYRSEYWDAVGLARVEEYPVALILFDQGVVSGPGNVIGRVQSLLGLKVDGVLGPQTLTAINRHDGHELAFKLVRATAHHYVAIVEHDSSQLKFLSGWLERLLSLLDCVIFGDSAA